MLLTTDIIVGFPGETDEDFEHTLDVVREVGFSNCYMFIYSKRTGTPAAVMENQVLERDYKPRFNKLMELVNSKVLEISEAQVGKTLSVLCEEVNDFEKGIFSGRADNNSIVHFQGNLNHPGKLVNVKITRCRTFYLVGEIEE